MLAKRIIPCLDVTAGRVVKGTITAIENDKAVIDVGLKSEGRVALREFAMPGQPHGLSVGAHRIPPGKQWQSPEVVFDPSVLALMDRISFEVHPEYEKLVSGNAASRPARIEVLARGQSFVGEARYPKGSPSPDAASTMTTDELVTKFVRNAEGVVAAERIDQALLQLLNLEQVEDFSGVMCLLAQ